MTAISLACYFALLFVVGYALLCVVCEDRRRPLVEVLALCPSLGAGMVALLLFCASLLGCKPSRGVLVLIFLGAVACVALRRRSLPFPVVPAVAGRRPLHLILIAASLLIFASVLAITIGEALLMPLWEIDSFMIWMYKAKVFHSQDILSTDYFRSLSLSYSHLDYPLLVPFLVSGLYAAAGQVDDSIGKLVFPFLFASFFCLGVTAFRWRLAAVPAVMLATLMMTLPPVTHWTSSGTADVVLTLFYLGQLYYTVKFIEERRREDMVFAILFTVFCAFTKNEGMVLCLINILVFAYFRMSGGAGDRKGVRDVVVYAAATLILLAPWLLFDSILPQTHENYPARMNIPTFLDNMARLPTVVCLFIGQFLQVFRWSGLWLILIAVAVIGRPAYRFAATRAVWMLFICHLALYVFVFVVSPFEPRHLASMSLERLILHTVPAAFLLIACHLSALDDEIRG